MNVPARATPARTSPALRYRDVGSAVRWLCDAFGFAEYSAAPDVGGNIGYAELSFGNTIIMLGATRGFEVDELMRQPDEIGGAETQASYYSISDIDAHYTRACAAGAQIVLALKTHADGTRGYTCRDPEGHTWTFGTYDPWERPLDSLEFGSVGLDREYADDRHSINFPKSLIVGLSVPAVALGFSWAWFYGSSWETSRQAVAAPTASIDLGPVNQAANEQAQEAVLEARRLLALQRAGRRAAERASIAASQEAERERGLRISAEQMAHQLAGQLASTQHAKELAISAADTAQQQLAEEQSNAAENARLADLALTDERNTNNASERMAAKAGAQLANTLAAKRAVEQALHQTRARLVFVSEDARQGTRKALEDIQKRMAAEQAARVTAEQATRQAREELARERTSKEEAWRTVDQLKKQLASLEGPTKSPEKAAPAKASTAAKVPKAPRRQPATQKTATAATPKEAEAQSATTPPAKEGWGLPYGPSY